MVNNELFISYELPQDITDEFSKREDLGFCIANYLDFPLYADAYRNRLKEGRTVIMDNGAYEAGEPLVYDDMVWAVKKLYEPDYQLYVICPDKPTDTDTTIDWTLRFKQEIRKACPGIKLAAVVQGSNLVEQQYCYKIFYKEGFDMLCLSFLWDRPTFLRNTPLKPGIRHHMLGCYGLNDIRFMRHHILLPPNTSIDTVKPIKAALQHQHLWEYTSSQQKWDPSAVFTPLQLQYARYNTWHMAFECHCPLDHLPSPDFYYHRPTEGRSDTRAC